ncbi:MAG TPA: hypothetical protein VF516_41800 [Kofleriaceae bacterium]
MARDESVALASTAASTALASRTVGQSKEWTIDPPAGWQEDAATERQLRDQMTAQKKIKFQGIEIRKWSPAVEDGMLLVQWFVLPIDGNIERQIDAFDRGMVKGFAQSATTPDGSRKVVGSMVIRDVRVDRLRGTDIQAHMVRRYQPASDGLHVLITVCDVTSDPALCDAALDGAQFTVPDPISLDGWTDAQVYRLAEVFGMLFGIAAMLLVLYVLRRRSRARTAAVKAAGSPGWPPRPGGAADGR